MSSETATDSGVQERIRRLVDRTIQRSRNGFRFVAGPPPKVGLTPKDVIRERGTMRLYHYHPKADEIYRVPVLLVMATTNRGYVFDLAPGQSMVEFLLLAGFDVYVLDWEAPTMAERGLDLDDYTQDFIPDCIRAIREDCGEPDVSIVAYCMGGVLSLIYAATHTDGPLKNLVCLTTPVNWHGMGLMAQWSDRRYFDVDRLVDTLGIIPEEFVTASFEMLRPAQKPAGRLKVWEQMWNDAYVESYRAFDRWGEETIPLAGEYFRQTTRELMWDNKLLTGELVVGRQRVDLANIRIPVMHVTAEHDHIVSTEASAPLLEMVGSEDREGLVLKGGHVSLIAGPNAARRMWPAVSAWLSERST